MQDSDQQTAPFLLFHSPAHKGCDSSCPPDKHIGCDSSCPPDKVDTGQRPADSTNPAVPQPSTLMSHSTLVKLSPDKVNAGQRPADSTNPAVPQPSTLLSHSTLVKLSPDKTRLMQDSDQHQSCCSTAQHTGCDSSCPPDKVNAGQRPADSTNPAVPQPSTLMSHSTLVKLSPDKVNAGQRPADSTNPAVPQPSTLLSHSTLVKLSPDKVNAGQRPADSTIHPACPSPSGRIDWWSGLGGVITAGSAGARLAANR
ncbi:hypothetical protein Bbelb_166040 [Branchiostoma belcheri]|nr:hypothetical protein Bbelb_166040 [Branchiostoma belcheri]